MLSFIFVCVFFFVVTAIILLILAVLVQEGTFKERLLEVKEYLKIAAVVIPCMFGVLWLFAIIFN